MVARRSVKKISRKKSVSLKKSPKKKVTRKKASKKPLNSPKKTAKFAVEENGEVKRVFKGSFRERTIWENIEYYNEHLIPIAVIALLIIIVVELFFEIHSHTIEQIIHIADYFVIAVFIIDLIFIFRRCRGLKFFFKHYWLDIIAVFPFIFIFRAFGSLFRLVLASEFLFGQTVLHETLELRKLSYATKAQKAGRFARMIARVIRVVTKTRFFKRFKRPGKRHWG